MRWVYGMCVNVTAGWLTGYRGHRAVPLARGYSFWIGLGLVIN